MASRKIWLFSFAVVLAVSSVAQAAPSAAERETARRLMDEGKGRLKANDLARAIEAFQKAHDIMHVPTTGIALARAHLAAGHLVEARDAALEVGRMPHEPGDPAVFDTARKHAKELDAQLKPRIPTVRIKIKGGTPARIAIDDVEISASITGEPVALNPGKRVVSAKNAEGGEVKGDVELAERDAKEVELTLPPGREAPTATSGPSNAPSSSSSTSAPPRKIAGFGNDGDTGPMGERTPLAEGLIYGGLGLAAVGVAVGTVTGVLTFSKASDVDPQCANDICDPKAKNDLDSARTLASISTIGFIAGGVGAAVGLVGFVLPRRPAHAKTAAAISWDWSGRALRGEAAQLTIGPAGAGLGGSF